MFTGIVQAKGRIAEMRPMPFGRRLVVDRCGWTPVYSGEPRHGDSICVSGVCLTVVENDGVMLHFDVIAETLAKSKLGDLQVGEAVNLEPAVTASQPLGGHFMQGHVDGVGVIREVDRREEECRITVEPPTELMDAIVPKGSVAIDGVSLTIAAVHPDCFEVALIPTTLQITTLGDVKASDRVNIEADILAKTVVQLLRRQQTPREGVTRRTLIEAGFIDDSINV